MMLVSWATLGLAVWASIVWNRVQTSLPLYCVQFT